MYSRVNYTIVGLFVLIFGAGLVWFFMWLAKYGIHQEYDTYKLYMQESVAGLSKDSVVKLHGVDVGHVSEIRIDPNNVQRVEIVVKIEEGTPIKKDMVAHTKMLGITGLLAIEIDGGSNTAPNLKAKDGKIPVIPSSPSWFSKTTKGLGDLSSEMQDLLKKAQKVLTDENIDNLSKTIENLEKATAKASVFEEQAISTMKHFDQRLLEYKDIVSNIGEDFAEIKKNSITAIDKIYQTSRNFNRLTLKVEKTLDRGDYNLKNIFEPMIVEVNLLSDQVNDLAAELKQSPNDIFFKSRKKRRGPGE